MSSWLIPTLTSALACPLPDRDKRPNRPGAGRGVEAEVAARRGDDLGGELAGRIEQPDEGTADRIGAGQHLALDDGLVGDVNAGREVGGSARVGHRTCQ